MKKGFIQTYTGSGKNKTTSAFGLAFRGFGKGFNILLTQFLKGDEAWDYGEIKSCEKFKDQITIIQSGKKKIVMEHNKDDLDRQLAIKAFDEMEELLFSNHYDLLVLDEILPALNLQLITQKRFFEFIQRCRTELPSIEIVLTGRMWSDSLYDKIKDISDLMTDGRCVKHYFDKHCDRCKRSFEYRSNYCPNCGNELVTINARDGIEF